MSEEKQLLLKLREYSEHLIEANKSAIEELNDLRTKNKFLATELADQKEELKRTKEALNVAKIAKGSTDKGNENQHDLREKIDELVREVDECIALLNM